MAKIFDKKNPSLPDSTKEKGKKKAQQYKGNDSNDDLKLDLIKDEIVKYFNWKKNVVVLILCICVTTALISAAYWGIAWWGAEEQKKQLDEVVDTEEISDLNQKISESKKEVDDIRYFEERMLRASDVLSSHVYWTNFFDFLEKNTLSQISYSNFSGGIDGNYTLNASAQEYSAIDAQVKKLLESDYVQSARVRSASSRGTEDGGAISFSLSLRIHPSIFTNYEK